MRISPLSARSIDPVMRRARRNSSSSRSKAREMKIDFPDGQTHLGIPIKFADEPGRIVPVAPALGEHSRSALAAVGYGAAELDALAASGAIR